ncbi:unnamed protein product [Lactuca virosa]|uniref:Uncharacterized protein n=1 Tax=Lactuca virosa TaxID=75947 RepID=A0AAU9N1A7_9ASTR|nr:unnamed protein product [Lactuca virosa]
MKQIDSTVENGETDSNNCGEEKEFCGSSDGGPVLVDRRRKDRDEEQDKVDVRNSGWFGRMSFINNSSMLWNNSETIMLSEEGIGANERSWAHEGKRCEPSTGSNCKKLNLKKQSGYVQESIPGAKFCSGVPVIRHNELCSNNSIDH